MKFFSRDTDMTSLAAALQLVVANYKPIPQLPSSTSLAVNGTSNGSSFQVQPPQALDAQAAKLKMAEWGEASLLYIPNEADGNSTAEANGANSFAASTVGPGKCPVASDYKSTATLPDPVFPAFDPVRANIMRYRQQQGVNLGNWFVAENWMSSTYFKCSAGNKAAEIDILKGFGTSATGLSSAKAFMEKHWDTWITEADFAAMAKMGINTVRLPIGYWSVGPWFCRNSPFSDYASVYAKSWRYIARSINWAAKYDIGVIVDLHGAYGSQNGQAHSGTSDGAINFFQQSNLDRTKEVLMWLAKEVSDVTNVVGIQLLNEPVDRTPLWTWYNSTMDAMRKASPEAATVPLYFHDAFNLAKGSKFVSRRNDFVVQDHHSYYVYTASDISLSATGHTSKIQGQIAASMQSNSNVARRNLIVGEWSCALNPGSLANSKNPDADERAFCEAQRKVYAQTTSGWTFWSWRMGSCDNNGGWCFQQATKQFLPATFDAWGLTNITASFYASATSASDKAKTLLDTVSRITIPNIDKLQLNVNKFAKATNETEASDAVEADDNIDDNVPLLTYSAKARDSTDPAASISDIHEGAKSRVGMVTGHSEQQQQERRGAVGGAAARAGALARRDRAELTRRATTQRMLAAKSGYNDGFKTAKYFASQTNLSRLGFAQQYIQDSWNVRLSKGKLAAGDVDQYNTQFKAGLVAAETAVKAAIKAA